MRRSGPGHRRSSAYVNDAHRNRLAMSELGGAPPLGDNDVDKHPLRNLNGGFWPIAAATLAFASRPQSVTPLTYLRR